MLAALKENTVYPDEYRVSRAATTFVARLHAALALCLHDDTQGVGGLMHLKYAAGTDEKPVALTDNILSSNLLLLDRFCKELRALGARKTTWRVHIVGHIPVSKGMAEPAATVVDLLRAYFHDSRLPVECREFERFEDIVLTFEPREGLIGIRP